MKFVKRDYWDESATHRPYRNCVHEFIDGEELPGFVNPMNAEPREKARPYLVKSILDDIPDGAVFEIHVRLTGEHVGGKFQLAEPHKYRRVDELIPRKIIRNASR